MMEAGASDWEDLREMARVVASTGNVPQMLRAAALLEYLQEWESHQSLLTSVLRVQRASSVRDKATEATTLTAIAKSWVALDATNPIAFESAEAARQAWKEVSNPQQEAAALIMMVTCGGSPNLMKEAILAVPLLQPALKATAWLSMGTFLVNNLTQEGKKDELATDDSSCDEEERRRRAFLRERRVRTHDEAVRYLKEGLGWATRVFGEHHHQQSAFWLQLARLKVYDERYEEAAALCEEALVSRGQPLRTE